MYLYMPDMYACMYAHDTCAQRTALAELEGRFADASQGVLLGYLKDRDWNVNDAAMQYQVCVRECGVSFRFLCRSGYELHILTYLSYIWHTRELCNGGNPIHRAPFQISRHICFTHPVATVRMGVWCV